MRDVTQVRLLPGLVSSSREIKNLPTRLIREANLEDDLKEVDRLMRHRRARSAPTRSIPHGHLRGIGGLSEPEPDLPPDDPARLQGPQRSRPPPPPFSEVPETGEESPRLPKKSDSAMRRLCGLEWVVAAPGRWAGDVPSS